MKQYRYVYGMRMDIFASIAGAVEPVTKGPPRSGLEYKKRIYSGLARGEQYVGG